MAIGNLCALFKQIMGLKNQEKENWKIEELLCNMARGFKQN